jgi:integrase
MMRLDAHNYRRRMELFFAKLEIIKTVPEEDKNILRKYSDYLISEGITFGRVNKYLYDLKRASLLLGKRFAEADEQDIRKIVAIFDRNENYSPWSKRNFKVAIRKFYTWLRGTKEYPPEVAWMKVYTKIRNEKTAEDMLSEEEVKKLIEFAMTPQERAFISTLYESGCRIGEIINLRIDQVKFDDYGAQLFVTGKTGFRRVRVVACVPYLVEYLNKHPLKAEPKAFLWANKNFNPPCYSHVFAMLQRVARRAGIRKKMNSHNFRHSRASYLANYLTEAQMKEFFGWQQDSKMAAVYIHLSGKNVDGALLKVYGIENNGEKKESIFKPKDCSRCQQVNQATNKFCSRAGCRWTMKRGQRSLKRG